MSLRHAKILARHAKKTPTCYATSYKNCDMLHLINNSTHENNTVNYLLCTANREMNELPNFRLKMAL